MYGRLFKDTHVMKLETWAMLANDPLKRHNAINTFLIHPNMLYYFQPLNINVNPKF